MSKDDEINFTIEFDFSHSAAEMADREVKEFTGMIARQVVGLVNNEKLTFTDAVIRVQDGVTRALIEQIQAMDLSSMIAGEILERIGDIMIAAATAAKEQIKAP
jgi:hypothetical protein